MGIYIFSSVEIPPLENKWEQVNVLMYPKLRYYHMRSQFSPHILKMS